jgi:AraC-like DNA-binding protein
MDKTLIIGILLMIGSAQGLLLSVVLFTYTAGNKTANRILAVLISSFSFMLFFHGYNELLGIHADKAAHEHFGQAIFALFAPLLYYYVLALTRRGFILHRRDALHLLPCYTLILLSILQSLTPERFSWDHQFNMIMPWLMMIQMSIYLYLSLRLLHIHQQKIKATFSALEKINLKWVYFLISGQLLIWPVAFLTEILGGDSRQWDLVWLLIAVFIYAMGYFGLRQPAIFTGRFTESPVSTPDIKKKYEKSTLSTEDSERISSRLNEMMSKEKLYLSSELSLPDLAQKLAVSTHHLSQMLNERIGKNFFEYINWLRVEEAKKLLKDENLNHLSIAGIAQEAGFYSLSAFNTIFKKSTGYTPSSYRKLPI